MPSIILTNTAASITELKTNPMAIVNSAKGESIAILNRNEPAFYCVPPAIYEYLMELADDAELAQIIESRKDDELIEVNLKDLRK